MKYSVVVPVYNRPDEVNELLESLTTQTLKDFEVIIVEDGSAIPCEDVCLRYQSKLDIHYYKKDNSGPGQSRNYGAERASGDFLLILDSDVVLPEGYIQAVEEELAEQPDTCAFGGPDSAHPSFTPTQKAISYSMTSFFTTGGIRGGKSPSPQPSPKGEGVITPKKARRKALDKFYPRSFNMGIRRDVYEKLGGFTKMRFGEDIDFSYRIVEAGYKTRLFSSAWVYHKRRTDFKKFFRQVYNSGIARINLEKRHPGTMKLVHMLPTVFTIGVIGLLVISFIGRILMVYGPGPYPQHRWYLMCALPWVPLLLYALLLFLGATKQYASEGIGKAMGIGFRSIVAAFVQLMGYGFGFIEAWWKRCVLRKDEFQAFEKTFYK